MNGAGVFEGALAVESCAAQATHVAQATHSGVGHELKFATKNTSNCAAPFD